MKTVIIGVVTAFLLSALSFGGVAPAKAEAGCSLGGYVTSTANVVDGVGSFSCPGDNGTRQLQVCLQRYTTSVKCSTAVFTGSSGTQIARAYCYSAADIYSFRVWVWLYGEDGSSQYWVSGYTNYWKNC